MKTRRHFSSSLRGFALKQLSAAVLAIALLASLAPIGVSSHAQGCSMPCCSGGSCSTGACDVSFGAPAKKTEPESHCEHGGGPMHVEVVEVNQSAEIDASELCGADQLTKSSGLTPVQSTPLHQNTIKPESFSKPCSSDCCAGAAVSSQLRRSRDVSILGDSYKPRGPDSSKRLRNNERPVFLSLQLRRLSPPRAPPGIAANA